MDCMKKKILISLASALSLSSAILNSAEAARFENWLPTKFSEGVVATPELSPRRKVGYCDRNGKLVIERKFDAARPFSEGLAAVRVDGKWGFIDHGGEYKIKPQFEKPSALDYPGDDPIDFSEGLAAVEKGGRVGFIDKDGSMVIDAKFGSAREFRNGLAAARDFWGKWGFIDKKGKFVISPQFADALSFSDGRAAIATGGKYPSEQKWGFIDSSGKVVIEPQYSMALSFTEGLALVLNLNNGTYSGKYIDKEGKKAFALECHGGLCFAEGLAPIPLKQFVYGYIDKQGKTAIPAQFEEARPFSEGLAVVKFSNNDWGLIDKSGKVVLKQAVRAR